MDARTDRSRLDALTGLRYVAALCVLLTHLAWNIPAGRVKLLVSELWAIGMPLFFTLSGFLMAYNYSDGFRSKYRGTLGKFFLARFARIYPIYFIVLLLWLALVGHVFHDLRDYPQDTAISLAMNATMTQNWAFVPLYVGSPEPRAASYAHYWIAWSVSAELFFYLMFPLAIVPVARYITNSRRALFAIWAVFVSYVAIDYTLAKTSPEPVLGTFWSGWELIQNPYIRFGEFLIGVLAGQAFLKNAKRPLSTGGWWFGSFVLVTAVPLMLYGNHWIWSAANKSVVSRVASANVLYAPLCAIIIYSLARVRNWPQRFLASRPLVLLGESSYCLYLIHPLVMHMFMPRLVGEGDLVLRRIVIFNHLMMLVVLHFLCFGFYRYAEVPLRSLIKGIFARKAKVIAPEAVVAPQPARLAA